MNKFEDFLKEGKKIQIKRRYTENHPASTVGKTASVRNAVLKAVKDGVITEEEFTKILSELSGDHRQWRTRNTKYFNVSEEGIKLSKWGLRILAELDEEPKAAGVFEATVEMDAINPDDKDFLKFLKKNKVKIINKEMDGPGGGYPVITMQGKRKDLEKVLADSELGWDDPDLAEYIEESVNEVGKGSNWAEKYVNDTNLYKKLNWYIKMGKGAEKKIKGKEFVIMSDGSALIWNTKTSDWELYKPKRIDKKTGKPTYESVNEKIKVTKDEWPYIEFKDGGKKHKVEFDYEDIIDDHGNEGQDQYWIGKDEDGQEWQIDVYADYRGEVEEIHYDTLMVAENKLAITESYEVIYSDGVSAMKKFKREQQALDFMKNEIASNKKLRDIAVYKPGMHSTTQTELVVKFWGDGSYLDNVSKKDKDLASKKLQENTNMENTFAIHESFAAFTAANGFLNEKLGSQILASILMSNREGKYGKKNLSDLAAGFYQMTKVALDKIQDEDFIVDNDPQKAFKNHGGSKNVIFFISDNEKENPYLPDNAGSYGSLATIPGGGILLAAMGGDREFYTNDWSRYSKNRSWKKDGRKGSEGQVGVNKKYRGWGASGLSNGKRIAEVSDRVIIVNLDLIRQKYSTQQLRDARAAARAGATAFKSDKDFKAENNNRYHQILATKAASMPIDKMVEGAIDELGNQIKAGLNAGEKTKYGEIKIGENSKGREVKLRDASNHMSNILDNYSRYCDYIRQGEESKERYGQAESYYERESKNYAKEIKDQIAKIKGFDYAW